MEKDKSKKRGKKSRLLILLFCTGIMLTTSTYAWFTSNKTVSVSSINANIAAKNGIQISVDGQNWKATIQNTDITTNPDENGANNQLPAILEPVSTILETDENGRLKMFYGEVDTNEYGSYILQSTALSENAVTANAAGGYSDYKFVSFDLYFKVTSATKIDITNASGVRLQGSGVDGIQNATRMAFVYQGVIADGSTLADIRAMKAATNIYLWEPNFNLHKASGIAHAHDTYAIDNVPADAAAPIIYNGLKSAFAFDKLGNNGVKLNDNAEARFAQVTPWMTTSSTFYDGEKRFEFVELQPGISKFRVYMWVEGQDIDCENNVSGGDIKFDLQFNIHEDADAANHVTKVVPTANGVAA